MQCHEIDELLERQPDEPLPAPAAAHVNGCHACQALTADLHAIRAAASSLSESGTEEVLGEWAGDQGPTRVWNSLRRQMEAEGIIRKPAPEREHVQAGWWSLFQRPAVAGAFLSFLLVSAGLIGYQSKSNPVEGVEALPQARFLSAGLSASNANGHIDVKDELQAVMNEATPKDTAVTVSLRRGLELVDNVIVVCEKSVREQPENEVAREYLYGAYEQKAQLLATAMNRNSMGGLE